LGFVYLLLSLRLVRFFLSEVLTLVLFRPLTGSSIRDSVPLPSRSPSSLRASDSFFSAFPDEAADHINFCSDLMHPLSGYRQSLLLVAHGVQLYLPPPDRFPRLFSLMQKSLRGGISPCWAGSSSTCSDLPAVRLFFDDSRITTFLADTIFERSSALYFFYRDIITFSLFPSTCSRAVIAFGFIKLVPHCPARKNPLASFVADLVLA